MTAFSYIHLVYDIKILRSYSLFVHSLVLFHASAVRLPREFRIGVVHFLRHVSPFSLSFFLSRFRVQILVQTIWSIRMRKN